MVRSCSPSLGVPETRFSPGQASIINASKSDQTNRQKSALTRAKSNSPLLLGGSGPLRADLGASLSSYSAPNEGLGLFRVRSSEMTSDRGNNKIYERDADNRFKILFH